MREKQRELEISIVKEMFRRYRDDSKEGPIRKAVNHLMREHAMLEKCVPDKTYKNRHNALVLKYMLERPMSDAEIIKQLEISNETLKLQLEKGFREIGFSLFWDIELLIEDY